MLTKLLTLLFDCVIHCCLLCLLPVASSLLVAKSGSAVPYQSRNKSQNGDLAAFGSTREGPVFDICHPFVVFRGRRRKNTVVGSNGNSMVLCTPIPASYFLVQTNLKRLQ